MTMVVVDANGEVTLQKALLEQAGARAGDTLEVELRVVGRRGRASGKAATWADLAGSLKRPGQPVLTIEEINDAIAEAGAAAGMAGLKDR